MSAVFCTWVWLVDIVLPPELQRRASLRSPQGSCSSGPARSGGMGLTSRLRPRNHNLSLWCYRTTTCDRVTQSTINWQSIPLMNIEHGLKLTSDTWGFPAYSTHFSVQWRAAALPSLQCRCHSGRALEDVMRDRSGLSPAFHKSSGWDCIGSVWKDKQIVCNLVKLFLSPSVTGLHHWQCGDISTCSGHISVSFCIDSPQRLQFAVWALKSNEKMVNSWVL